MCIRDREEKEEEEKKERRRRRSSRRQGVRAPGNSWKITVGEIRKKRSKVTIRGRDLHEEVLNALRSGDMEEADRAISLANGSGGSCPDDVKCGT